MPWDKLLDYGILGIVVLVLGKLAWVLAHYIVRKFEETTAACLQEKRELITKLETRDRVHEHLLGGFALDMKATAAQAIRALEANAKIPWDRIISLAEREEERATEETRRGTRRSGEHRTSR